MLLRHHVLQPQSFARSLAAPLPSRCISRQAIPQKQISYTVSSKGPPSPNTVSGTVSSFSPLASTESDDDIEDYRDVGVKDIIKQRSGWLGLFCGGLIVSAFVIENFEDIIEQQVALSFFVPLIMGHGGNTGSQTVSTLIRALAFKQARWRDATSIVFKESVAGAIMGAMLGAGVMALAVTGVLGKIDPEVGLVIMVALPAVSLWSNGLAAFITLASHKLRLDPTMTSGPLVATMVDTSGLLLYFVIAQAVLNEHLYASALETVRSLTS